MALAICSRSVNNNIVKQCQVIDKSDNGGKLVKSILGNLYWANVRVSKR